MSMSMSMSMSMRRVILFALLALALPTAALADSVVNPSFETLPSSGLPNGCGVGCSYSVGAIPGWTSTGSSFGQFQPGTQDGNFTFFNSLPAGAGITSAYSSGGTISQTTVGTVIAGVLYTFSVDLGRRNDGGFASSADLVVNGTVVATASGTAPTPGHWSTFTASFTGTAAEAGHPITIQLISSGFQGNFDNVQLTGQLTEPSALEGLLLGTGLLGFVEMARRKLRLGT